MGFIGTIIWLGFAIAVGMAATRRYGRSGVGWFVLSVLISPLLGFFLLIIVGGKPVQNQPDVDWRKVDWSGKSNVVPIAPDQSPPLGSSVATGPSPGTKLAVVIVAAIVVVGLIGLVIAAGY
jgi:hypothetical protein